MALYLTEEDVNELLTMDAAVDVLEKAFLAQAEGKAGNAARVRLHLGTGDSNTMSAVAPTLGVMGLKTYGVVPGYPTRMYVVISSTHTGELLALLEASRMGEIRTGAASGVATKYMARQDASSVGVLGSGAYAPDQLLAVCAVRDIGSVKVFSRTPERRERFAADMSAKLGIDVSAVESAEACVRDVDVLITITNSPTAVFSGEWLSPGTHINAAGAMRPTRRELDDEAVRRANVIVTDDVDQAKHECGDLIYPIEGRLLEWEQVHNLWEVVAGTKPGRNADSDITLFESQGMALEDIAACIRVYELATQKGVGQELKIRAPAAAR
ncbi:MAG: ornithine cyclodeaminase family protein [Chloroflexi bacterium]|nr:ornithine cyclodeaminase family protein [Chloroflexota bacterium]